MQAVLTAIDLFPEMTKTGQQMYNILTLKHLTVNLADMAVTDVTNQQIILSNQYARIKNNNPRAEGICSIFLYQFYSSSAFYYWHQNGQGYPIPANPQEGLFKENYVLNRLACKIVFKTDLHPEQKPVIVLFSHHLLEIQKPEGNYIEDTYRIPDFGMVPTRIELHWSPMIPNTGEYRNRLYRCSFRHRK